jgi:site-specific DNA-methyltransferase (adenine-specific)
MAVSIATNEDCMDMMARYEDKFFDLAIVDPEFGIGIGNSPRLVTDKGLKAKDWDNKPIDDNYFIELFRVSKNQIIWGGNYYNLGVTKHCIIWDKKQPEDLSFGMFDFAWTSYDMPNKMFRYSVLNEKDKIHPTQKPIQLYLWLLNRYSESTFKVLDTHLGSGSHRIAAHTLNLDLYSTELDKDYFEAQEKRFKEAVSMPLFDSIVPISEQGKMF